MRCPFCFDEDTQVKDSRPSEDNSAIRRRRECAKCGERFTTFERVQLREITVIKSGGRRQPFERDKIIRSMQTVLRKRPVELEDIEKAANDIVRQLESEGEAEVESRAIGELVMKALINLDVVGYIRYASVYNDFRDPSDFDAFVQKLSRLKSAPKARKAG